MWRYSRILRIWKKEEVEKMARKQGEHLGESTLRMKEEAPSSLLSQKKAQIQGYVQQVQGAQHRSGLANAKLPGQILLTPCERQVFNYESL